MPDSPESTTGVDQGGGAAAGQQSPVAGEAISTIQVVTPAVTVHHIAKATGLYIRGHDTGSLVLSVVSQGGRYASMDFQFLRDEWVYATWDEQKGNFQSNTFPLAQPDPATQTTTGVVTSPPKSLPTQPAQPTQIGSSETQASEGKAPTQRASSDDSGIAPGAVAGAAIGSLIAGALIAGLIMWFCLRKTRKSRHGRDQESSMLALVPGQEKGPAANVLSLASASPVSRDVSGILPQPLEDEAISSGFSGIGVAIKNHVQSFYHSSRVSPALLDLDDLQRLGSDLPLSTGTLSTLLGNTDTREVALRFCIGWIVVSRMQLSSSPNSTLLPPQIADFFSSMAIGNHASQREYLFLVVLSVADNHVAQTTYLAHWRGLTAELLHSTYGKNSFTTSDPRLRSIENAINALDGILLPFADSRMANTQRMQNLREILKRAATFAYTLFSQPSTYEFDWQGQQQGGLSEGLCVFPAFVQVTDESGEAVRPPRVLSEAIVRSLD